MFKTCVHPLTQFLPDSSNLIVFGCLKSFSHLYGLQFEFYLFCGHFFILLFDCSQIVNRIFWLVTVCSMFFERACSLEFLTIFDSQLLIQVFSIWLEFSLESLVWIVSIEDFKLQGSGYYETVFECILILEEWLLLQMPFILSTSCIWVSRNSSIWILNSTLSTSHSRC